VLRGSLSPECAALLAAMLDSLGTRTDPEDHRTREQRHHDALQQAASRLLGSGTLPQRGGQPVKAWVHISLACDAPLTPVVTGDIDPPVIDELIKLATDLAGADPTDRGRASPEQAIIARAVALVSGPNGLASHPRRSVLGARLGGPSLPLDAGFSENVPVGIRNAVWIRDQHCRWAGGCRARASHCHVHHTTHKADGGATSVQDCVLLCPFHHLIAIHERGWTLTLNPDGTTTAVSPDGTRILHSHGPPARPG